MNSVLKKLLDIRQRLASDATWFGGIGEQH
jgi:hypothetical protein